LLEVSSLSPVGFRRTGNRRAKRKEIRYEKKSSVFVISARPNIFGFALQHHPNDID
jgi:hypothetical protein